LSHFEAYAVFGIILSFRCVEHDAILYVVQSGEAQTISGTKGISYVCKFSISKTRLMFSDFTQSTEKHSKFNSWQAFLIDPLHANHLNHTKQDLFYQTPPFRVVRG
jgi:hypothetical protein